MQRAPRQELPHPPVSPLDVDDKKLRHRLLVKRAYHQKIQELSALRDEAASLEVQYKRQLARSKASIDARVASGHVASEGPVVLHELYVQLVAIKAQLQRENRSLKALWKDHVKFQKELRQISSADNAAAARTNAAEKPYMTIRPLTEDDCFDAIRRGFERAKKFINSNDSLQLRSEVFGWTHRYRFTGDGKHLQYALSKTFRHVTAYEMAQRGWKIMTEQYSELHSTTMHSNMYLVQRVDDSNYVFCRVMQRKHVRPITFKTLLLASLFEVENGYMAIFQSLDHGTRIVEDALPEMGEGEEPPQVVWLPMLSWTHMENVDDEHAHFQFGGEMRHTSEDNAQFWMMELLMMMMRYENKAVGPLFKLT